MEMATVKLITKRSELDRLLGPFGMVGAPQASFGCKNPFLAPASGDGMRNVGIYNGNVLLCDMIEPEDGDIVIAVVNGEKVCRRFFNEGDVFRFRREDGCTPDVITTDCIICGVVIASIPNMNMAR